MACFWSVARWLLEDRMYCSIDDGRVSVILNEGERSCLEYQSLLQQAVDRADTQAQTAYRYRQRATTETDKEYRQTVFSSYERQQRQLIALERQITDAMISFERVLLLRLQGHMHDMLRLDKLRCMNTRPTFRIGHVTSRHPLCRLGQERQITTMQTTESLDEFIDVLREYARRRQAVLDNT